MKIKFNQEIWLLCPAHVGSRLLFCVLYPFPFRFFFLFLFLFRSPGSWFSRRPLKVCCSSKIIKLLSGSLLHTRNHIYSVKANWMEFYIKVLYIVIKRKGFQVMEVGINILNWPPSSVIFPLIFSISLLICSLILPKEKKWYGLFLTAKLRSHKIWNFFCYKKILKVSLTERINKLASFFWKLTSILSNGISHSLQPLAHVSHFTFHLLSEFT